MRSVPEWCGATDDTQIPSRVKIRIWFKYEGRCAKCTRKIPAGETPQYDHILALCNSGQNRESNIQLLCEWCHSAKTKTDVAEKSLAYRKMSSHIGITRKPKGRPMPGTRASGIRRRLNGTVERRT
jgi:hypothetical protein